MKVTPIIFATPMSRAAWEGRKTQTRRVVKLDPQGADLHWHNVTDMAIFEGGRWEFIDRDEDPVAWMPCPYGQPGDLLWVRETFRDVGKRKIEYRTNSSNHDLGPPDWCPSLFMPRWASRMTLRLTDVRVERVQEITGEEAVLEGIERIVTTREHWYTAAQIQREKFRELWDSLNTNRGYGWDTNPWVWVLTFEVLRGNIDNFLGKNPGSTQHEEC